MKAVTADEAIVAVSAGPGTGKTKTLIARIAWLLEKGGAKPSEIAAVTFTNQAASEMRRLEERFGGKSALHGMTIGTFHSTCLKLLGSPTLLSRSEALNTAAEILQKFEIKETPGRFLQQISAYKNGILSPDELTMAAISSYCQKLSEWDALDFDDLLIAALEDPTAKIRGFTHLLIDEFQNINGLQFELIRRWAANGKSLFVIGDPDQFIYGFRGAAANCFDRLRNDNSSLRIIRLIQNYRSTPQILNCAHQLLAGSNPSRQALIAHRPDGEKSV